MGKGRNELRIDLEGEAAFRLLDAVIGYEALSRGLTRGQAAYELLLESVETWRYPAGIRKHIGDAERGRTERAAREALAASRGERVA